MTTTLKVLLCALAAGAMLAILVSMLRSRRLLTNLLLSCLSGVGALYAVNAIGLATGTSIPVNALSLGVSAAAGVPGVIGLLVGEILLK